MKINELKVGQSAEVLSVGGQGNIRQHFLGMGIIPGSIITLRGRAPMGDPLEILVQGYSLTLRIAEAEQMVGYRGHQGGQHHGQHSRERH